jgi:hypothetical protein
VSTELMISSIPPSLNVLVYAHVNVGVFSRTPFVLFRLVDSTFQRMDGVQLTKMSGCGFPRLKGRTNASLFFFLDY